MKNKETSELAQSLPQLHFAAIGGDLNLITDLLRDKGADVNEQGPKELTALHCAVMSNQIAVARILLYYKANTEAKTNDQ